MMPHTPHVIEPGTLDRVTRSAYLAGHLGACERPIWMTGQSLLVDAQTGVIVNRHDGDREPVSVRCRSRKASECRACSALYKLDAYHLISAGLRGGKDTPVQVAERPRLFVTLTAPSFGPVHLGPAKDGTPRQCRPARGNDESSCGRWHLAGDPLIGTPLDPDGYDYPGQVMFNASAGTLWRHLTTEIRRALARTLGLPRRQAAKLVRVVFAKVAEFQSRGVVHYHAIVRLDGPHGPQSAPPAWITADHLEGAIRQAAGTVSLTTPGTATVAARTLGWGRQLDIQYLPANGDDISDLAVARYVAKYATKAAENVGLDLPPLFCRACNGYGARTADDGENMLCRTCSGTGRRARLDLGSLTGHSRALVETCWRLGGLPAFADLRLRRWAHQAGYRGHFTTKSRSYSTTFAALRAERGHFNISQQALSLGINPSEHKLITVGDWRYAGNETARHGSPS